MQTSALEAKLRSKRSRFFHFSACEFLLKLVQTQTKEQQFVCPKVKQKLANNIVAVHGLAWWHKHKPIPNLEHPLVTKRTLKFLRDFPSKELGHAQVECFPSRKLPTSLWVTWQQSEGDWQISLVSRIGRKFVIV